MSWKEQARGALGITSENTALNRALESKVDDIALALQNAFEEGQEEAKQDMRDFLAGRVPEVTHSSGPTG